MIKLYRQPDGFAFVRYRINARVADAFHKVDCKANDSAYYAVSRKFGYAKSLEWILASALIDPVRDYCGSVRPKASLW